MKDGNYKEIKKEIGLGLFLFWFFVEGLFKKEKMSFYFFVWCSFLDLFYSGV